MRKFAIKVFVVFSFILFFCFDIFAAPRKPQKGQEDWRALQKAKDSFEKNDFGTAVKFAEQAKVIRSQNAKWQTYILDETLKNSRVRRAGDSIERVSQVLNELKFTEASKIVSMHIEKHGLDFFNGSYSDLIEFVSVYAHYPEADFFLGKIYKLEGEYSVALNYMKDAYEYSVNLDVSMEKYDLLYELAELSYDLGSKDDYEKYLLVIASDDSVFTNLGYMDALLHIINTDSSDTLEKFFLLYRAEDTAGLKAFVKLGKLYMSEAENDKALKFNAFAGILAVTKIESVLMQRINGFKYSNFKTLLAKSSSYSDIVEWGIKNGVWELFCDLAESAANSGKIVFSRSLFVSLSESSPVEYWKSYASEKIVKSEN